jgi:hypothetical protein
MSHLIIEQGKEVGKEVTVPPSGMKFGRSPANDLVLEDEAVMLFQGRFFFKTDGTLWVTDFSAGEKTTVGGLPVDEHALKVGDLVEVGGTAFRIISTSLESQESAAPAAAEEEIDLGFKPSRKATHERPHKERSKSSSLIHRVLQVLVTLLVLLALVLVAPELMKLTKQTSLVSPNKKTLSFSYECVKGNWKNIFRYHLELAEDGTASIQVDDLRNRHIAKSVKVSDEALGNLSRRLGGTGFFEIEGDRVIDAQGKYELFDIAISRNGAFNHVRVLNREPPSEIKKTISVLEEFVFGELDVPFTLMEDPGTLVQYAEEAFRLGEARFAEREVRQGNLAEAIESYKEAVVYLETLEPKPELYRQSVQKMGQAKAEQDARYKDHMFNADRAIRLGDWREAAKQLRILAELIPDRSDDRYEIISSKQLSVEEKLR